MAGGLHPCARSAVVLTHTSQLGPCSSLGVFSPLSLYLLCSAQGQTLPWEGQRRHTRPGLITSKLFDGLIWEDTFVSASLPLAQLKGIKARLIIFFSLEPILGKLILLGDVNWTQPVNFFQKNLFLGALRKCFPIGMCQWKLPV